MRHLRPAEDGERGAVLLLAAVMLVSLLTMAALVVDVGALVQERRTLQNGADAGALAIAKDCTGTGCGAYLTTAGNYANLNADDGASTAENVCGTSPMPACTSPPSVPTGAGYVRVTTRTRTTGGSAEVPFHFAGLVGMSGATVRRQATAAWGGPSSLTSALPLTFSLCEFNQFTSGPSGPGTVFVAPPPPLPASSAERVITFHDPTGGPTCPAGPANADLPGGFGWLKTSTDCNTPSSTTGWYDDKTGRSPPNSCDPPEMKALLGKVVHVPIFDQTNDLNGSNGKYHIKGYAAFYMTGYSIEGQYKEKSLISNSFPCSGAVSCISGFFVNGSLLTGGTIGGPSMGVTVIQMIG